MRLGSASKKVLIFGIEGFTGIHLSKYLQNDVYEVFGTSYNEAKENIFEVDIRKKDDVIKVLQTVVPDYIIVLSAISSPAHGDNEDFYSINTLGAINVLDSIELLHQTPKKIVMVSSAAVYGHLGLDVLDESLCPKPVNHYGASKYSMECLAANYFSKLNVLITRPFNYTGVGQLDNFLIPKIVSHFKENKKEIELGNLNVEREFNDISYVCEVYKKLLESDKKSFVVNICSGRGIKLLDVVEMMDDIAGYTIEVKVNQALIRKDDIKILTGSTKKLFSLIEQVNQKEFKETLRDMFET